MKLAGVNRSSSRELQDQNIGTLLTPRAPNTFASATSSENQIRLSIHSDRTRANGVERARPAQATLVVRRARSPRRRLLDPPIIDGRREFSRSARLRETYCRAALARLGSHSARGNRISRRPLRAS